MDTPSEKAREARLRRLARGQGLALVRSRNRTPGTLVFGTYGLTDPYRNAWAATRGADGYGLDLDEIEAWLAQSEAPPV